jgi:hypothetical protein
MIPPFVILCLSLAIGIFVGMGTEAGYGFATFFLVAGILSFFYGLWKRMN